MITDPELRALKPTGSIYKVANPHTTRALSRKLDEHFHRACITSIPSRKLFAEPIRATETTAKRTLNLRNAACSAAK